MRFLVQGGGGLIQGLDKLMELLETGDIESSGDIGKLSNRRVVRPPPLPDSRPLPTESQPEDPLYPIFAEYNINGNAGLDQHELKHMMDAFEYNVSAEYLKGLMEIFGEVDANHDNLISFEEFQKLWEYLNAESETGEAVAKDEEQQHESVARKRWPEPEREPHTRIITPPLSPKSRKPPTRPKSLSRRPPKLPPKRLPTKTLTVLQQVEIDEEAWREPPALPSSNRRSTTPVRARVGQPRTALSP